MTMEGSSEGRNNKMTRSELYEIMLEKSSFAFCSKEHKEHLFERIISKFEVSQDNYTEVKRCLSRFTSELEQKWRKVGRSHTKLSGRNKSWLDGNIYIINRQSSSAKSNSETIKRGRPSKSFEQSSDRSKRRKTKDLRDMVNTHELQYAAQMKLRSVKESDAANVSKHLMSSPTRATKYREGFKKWDQTIPQVPVEKALSMVVDAGLSRNQYELIKSVTKESGCDVFPSYKKIKDVKEKCYPSEIEITETKGQVPLQGLLKNTAQGIMLAQEEVFENRTLSKNLTLISKWGCDGTNATMYKQSFENESDTDEFIFFTSLVPLQLLTEDNITIWRNPRPSSSRFCRPIKIEFIHETVEVTVNEVARVENEIKNLVPTDCCGFEISHELLFTMIDGKVCNSVTSTKSAQRCYLCSLTSKNYNDLEKVKQTNINEDVTRFGLSTLHAWIRIFENLLHLSYKLSIKKWQARSKEEKEHVEKEKKNIQKEFKVQLGLIVDKPKQSYGNSNDGNTARRFFENSEISSKITGIDENLINKCHIILQAISCGHPINVENFKVYSQETAELYVNLYKWYPMSSTMHKILMHSSTVIKSCLLPIGMLSEEAQEARNKDIRKYRENFARKCSRKSNMEDVLKRLLVSSDPFISQMMKYKRSNKKYCKELINLLSEA